MRGRQVDKALWVKRGRRIAVAALVGMALLAMGGGAIRWWSQRQEQGLAQAAEHLDGLSESLPTPTSTPKPTSTSTPTPVPTPTPPAPPPSPLAVTASMAAVPESPGPVVVPLALTVTRSDAGLGDVLSARLSGDGYFRLGATEWYTDGTGMAWEVTTEVAVDSFQGSGTLTWTVMLGEQMLELPLRWQTGQGEIREEGVLDDVDPTQGRVPSSRVSAQTFGQIEPFEYN